MMAPLRWSATDDVVESDEAVSDDEGIEGPNVSLLRFVVCVCVCGLNASPLGENLLIYFFQNLLLWLSFHVIVVRGKS